MATEADNPKVAQIRWMKSGDLRHERLWFYCPGCKYAHAVPVKRPDGDEPSVKPFWQWNGDINRPTLLPSLNTVGAEPKCHCFIRDGQIQFLNDCTHELKGKTVPLPELPDWLK